MAPTQSIVIGTRGSDLALWQARHVQHLLGGAAAGVELQIIKTRGDKLLDIPLQNQVDKGFFTKELEAALLDRHVDLAVHSLKDLPTDQPAGLQLAAVPQRADTGDVLFLSRAACDSSQPFGIRAGAQIGTASLRRTALLNHFAPQAQAAFLRGNVPTRLGKAKSAALDGVVLARAGVARLGLDFGDLLAFDLDPRAWLPAAGQGALGLQCRQDDAHVQGRLAAVADPDAAQAVQIERDVLKRMEGGCHSPFGALAERTPGGWVLRAGTVDAANRWLAVQVAGDAASLGQQAEDALRRALATGAAHGPAEGTWLQPARPWC